MIEFIRQAGADIRAKESGRNGAIAIQLLQLAVQIQWHVGLPCREADQKEVAGRQV